MNSKLFQDFLKSAVQELKESNIVNPTRSKRHRMSFLGRVRTEETQKAEVSEWD